MDSELCWFLLYTKPRAECWADVNLRRQGYATLLPLVRRRRGFGPLFPRYLFAGYGPGQRPDPIRSTRGVLYVVHCGEHPARVPADILSGLRARMDEFGVVSLADAPATDPLYAARERERVRALVKLARAGFRVVAA